MYGSGKAPPRGVPFAYAIPQAEFYAALNAAREPLPRALRPDSVGSD